MKRITKNTIALSMVCSLFLSGTALAASFNEITSGLKDATSAMQDINEIVNGKPEAPKATVNTNKKQTPSKNTTQNKNQNKNTSRPPAQDERYRGG